MGKDFVEGGEGGVVEANYRSDGGIRFVDLGLTVQLGVAGVEDLHLFHRRGVEFPFFLELEENTVELGCNRGGGV